MPPRIRIGFVLLSDSRDPIPSTRVSVLNMLPFLRAAGFEPELVFDPSQSSETPDLSGIAPRLLSGRYDIVYFQKVRGPSAETLSVRLREAGVKTVFGVCDRVDAAMAQATDLTIAVTEHLRNQYPPAQREHVRVVHDGIEEPLECRVEDSSSGRGSWRAPLSAVLVTSATLMRLPVIRAPPSWLAVTVVGAYAPISQRLQRWREMRWALAHMSAGDRIASLRMLASRNVRLEAWDRLGVYDHMRHADIGIIPVESDPEGDGPLPAWQLKSENRLTMKMSMGLPVVATPVPSYIGIIEHGVNGFFANSRREWMHCLDALRDPELRRAVGQRARLSVQERFSMRKQADLLIDILAGLVGRQTVPPA